MSGENIGRCIGPRGLAGHSLFQPTSAHAKPRGKPTLPWEGPVCATSILFAVALALLLAVLACPKSPTDSNGEPDGPTDGATIGPADPPYTSTVVYPSGLELKNLVQDPQLTATYPEPSGNPWGGPGVVHYQRVGYFLDLPSVDGERRVSENFKLREYTDPPKNHGDLKAYVDAQIVSHVQQIRTGLGRPLIVSSSFRGPEYNSLIGGSPYSRHQYGDAVDIDVDQSQPNHEALAQEIYNMAALVGVDYIEPLTLTRYSWVHVDDRGFKP